MMSVDFEFRRVHGLHGGKPSIRPLLGGLAVAMVTSTVMVEEDEMPGGLIQQIFSGIEQSVF